jgi:hypothetical protein
LQNNALNFCFDHLTSADLGYPNLAKLNLASNEFDTTWPRTLPVRLFSYFPQMGIPTNVWTIDQAPNGSWYPVGLAWHDFDCDYLALVPPRTYQRIKIGQIRMLFYYHEGDNPYRIKQRLDMLCARHGFPCDSYVFVSANSAADALDNFIYFPDHELFFRYINRRQRSCLPTVGPKQKDFTVINRTHKWWRATCMADLHSQGLLENSFWSYNSNIDINDEAESNPISLDQLLDVRVHLHKFLKNTPYTCDTLDPHAQNDHRQVNLDLYTKSYCHIILETHFDADQSGGTFLTEKTYKCIKFGQPFVIVGPPNSIAILRSRGYRVFDHVIDHSYDTITDNTERWLALRATIRDLKFKISPQWLAQCQQDLEWNQNHFANGYGDLLNDLVNRLGQLSTGTV